MTGLPGATNFLLCAGPPATTRLPPTFAPVPAVAPADRPLLGAVVVVAGRVVVVVAAGRLGDWIVEEVDVVAGAGLSVREERDAVAVRSDESVTVT